MFLVDGKQLSATYLGLNTEGIASLVSISSDPINLVRKIIMRILCRHVQLKLLEKST